MTTKSVSKVENFDDVLTQIVARLVEKFNGIISNETIALVVKESYLFLAQKATVTVHLSVLTERIARDRLTELAKSRENILNNMRGVKLL